MPGSVDVFDSGERALRRPRVFLAVAVLLLVAAVAGLVLRQRTAEQVALAASLEVTTSATSPPGGAVRWAVVVRNDGARPVRVTSVATTAGGIVLRSRPTPGDPVQPGRQVAVPVSIRLTCSAHSEPHAPGLRTAVRIQGTGGRAAMRTVPLTSAASLVDVVDTLCSVQPGLRGKELSGPVAAGHG